MKKKKSTVNLNILCEMQLKTISEMGLRAFINPKNLENGVSRIQRIQRKKPPEGAD